mgnify:CR=1 FL=1
MSEKVKKMRNEGISWKKIADELDISIYKAKSLYDEKPEFPKYLDATVVKKVINPRLILVKIMGDKKLRPAIIRQGLVYNSGKKIKVEKINEKHYRVV